MNKFDAMKVRRLGQQCAKSEIDAACLAYPELQGTLTDLWQTYGGALVFESSIGFVPLERSGFEGVGGALSVEVLLGPGNGPNSVALVSRQKLEWVGVLCPFARLAGSNLLFVDKRGRVLTWLPNDAAEREVERTFLAANSQEEFFRSLIELPEEQPLPPKNVRVIDQGLGDLIRRTRSIN